MAYGLHDFTVFVSSFKDKMNIMLSRIITFITISFLCISSTVFIYPENAFSQPDPSSSPIDSSESGNQGAQPPSDTPVDMGGEAQMRKRR